MDNYNDVEYAIEGLIKIICVILGIVLSVVCLVNNAKNINEIENVKSGVDNVKKIVNDKEYRESLTGEDKAIFDEIDELIEELK